MTEPLKPSEPPEDGVEQHYTMEEVAAMFALSRWTIREYIRDGRLKAVKIGHRWRIPHSSCVALAKSSFASDHTVKSRQPARMAIVDEADVPVVAGVKLPPIRDYDPED